MDALDKFFTAYMLAVVLGLFVTLFCLVCGHFGWLGIELSEPDRCYQYANTPIRDVPAKCLSHFDGR